MIIKLTERVTKSKVAIAKKKKQIESAEKALSLHLSILDTETDPVKLRDANWEVRSYQNEIPRMKRDLERKILLLEKQESQLDRALDKAIILGDLPEPLLNLQTELVSRWDDWDIEKKSSLKKKYDELGYSGFVSKYKRSSYELLTTTEQEIHNKNVKFAEKLVLDLYERVSHITGTITKWNYINLSIDNTGNPVLTGYVVGENGSAEITSILAGGFNVQRLHIRILVKPY